jgi:methanogenic corrinoid protein MtbC1
VSTPGAFAAAVLDTTLAAQAAGVALELRERLGAERVAALGRFDELAADLRVRLAYLAEALALDVPALYLQHVEWLRGAHAARGLEGLAQATHAALAATLRTGLPPHAWSAVEPLLAAEERALARPPHEPPSALDGPRGPEIARLLEAVLSGRRRDALACSDELARTLGEEELVERVLAGVQRELGRLWHRGEIHVGEEHLGSRLCEEILARLAARAPAEAHGPRVLVASTAGDLHEIGARIVARRLERAGFELCFLGANVPRADLVLALSDLRPALLALSVTLALHLRGAAETIAAAHALEPRVPVLLGGAPFALVSDAAEGERLVRALGADAVALDGAEAERAARALTRPAAG